MRKSLVVACCVAGTSLGGVATALGAPTQYDATFVRTSTTVCPTSGTPNAYEVWIYEDAPYLGKCRVLTPGFHPSPANMGIANDAMSSLRIGSSVRARIFKDSEYRGSWRIISRDNPYIGDYGWNDIVSSLRVELGYRRTDCQDYQDGEMSLYVDASRNGVWSGDCVVLPVTTSSGLPRSFATPADMGIANDSISAIVYWSSFNRMAFFRNARFDTSAGCQVTSPYQITHALPEKYGIIIGPNDQYSSIGTAPDKFTCSPMDVN